MNGNITKDGIQKDLDWMERIGVGGFQNFDAALSTPQAVEQRLVYMTPEWKDAFRFATELADEKGLEMAIAGSPGWSESGGPWVTPEQAMKKIVWSEKDIQGGAEVKEALPQPPTETGTFQNIKATSRGFGSSVGASEELPKHYEDFAVIAVKMPASYSSLESLNPRITSNAGVFELAQLTDGDLVAAQDLALGTPGSQSWIQYEFAEPQTVYAVDVVTAGGDGGFGRRGGGGPSPVLESSEDGVTFTKVVDIPSSRVGLSEVAFPGVKAKYFRLAVAAPAPQPMDPRMAQMFGGMMGMPQPRDVSRPVAEFKLYTTPKVNRFVEKAGFVAAATDSPTPEYPAADVIAKADVIDITDKMAEDGTLAWTAPEGTWKVIRFGYSLTGHQNSPASPEATGLEVDKLDKDAVTAYFNQYLDMYEDATGGLMGEKGLKYIITDSWEAGCLNWTGKMFEDFQSMRGYDLHTWLPALVGYVVESSENTDKFLFDFRKTLGELTAKNHYDALTDILAARGMARYTESHENNRAFVGDGMEVKKTAAVPMSAMWTTGLGQSGADIRESSSVSHIYGQKYVAAESLTAGGNAWSYVPETLKPTADWEMANGLNRFVYHCSPHQPLDTYKPGFSLGPFGQWFTRHETWAENAAKPWITYLARSSYMFQQGKFVADILYFYGEGSNITAEFGNQLPPIPEGYNFDFVNADAIVNAIEFKNGSIVSPAGTKYSFIYIDPTYAKKITLPVLKKLQAMVKSGAVIVGNKPVGTPSLEDDVNEYASVVNALWASESGANVVGKGKVLGGMTMDQAVAELGITPDVQYTKPNADTEIKFVHRKAGDIQWFWLLSRTGNTEDIKATLKVSGYEPEVWNAMTGEISKPSYKFDGENTIVDLHFDSHDALFVVFRNKTDVASYDAPAVTVTPVTAVEGPWTVAFNQFDAPAQTTFETLSDWSQNADKTIKYYSGTASYTKTIALDQATIDAGQVWLNLGDVQNIAEVVVNGKDMGLVWKTPFRFNISDAVVAGDNQIEVKVTNMWVNRLIGDVQPGAKQYAQTSQQSYRPDAPLKPSGLIGPVCIESVR